MDCLRSDCIDHGRTESLIGAGYLRIRYKGKKEYAHRVAYCETKQIPIEYIQGSVIRHTCDNPRCINPQHLLLGTHQDNSTDMTSRGRQAKGVDINAAKLSPEDIIHIRKRIKPRCRLNGYRALAKLYGVTHRTIISVVAGKTWGHIQ